MINIEVNGDHFDVKKPKFFQAPSLFPDSAEEPQTMRIQKLVVGKGQSVMDSIDTQAVEDEDDAVQDCVLSPTNKVDLKPKMAMSATNPGNPNLFSPQIEMQNVVKTPELPESNVRPIVPALLNMNLIN